MKIKLPILFLSLFAFLSKQSAAQYCTTSHGACYAPEITLVTISTLSAANVCSGSGGYNYYSPSGTNTTTLQPGQTYTLSVSVNSSAIGSVWFDFNGNQLLETTEWTQLGTSFTGTASVSITVPSNAVVGTTRMRIRTRGSGNTNGSSDACSSFGSGETEDYDITIGNPVPPPTLGPLPVISSVSPLVGPVGSLDTINGTNFNTTPTNNIVTFGTVRAQVNSATANRLVVTVPSGLTNKSIGVTVNGLSAFSTKAFQPSFANSSNINSLSFTNSPGVMFTSNYFTQASPIDFDNDGKMDIAAMSYGYLYIFRNIGATGGLNGTTSFDAPINIYNSLFGNSFIVADMDGDGKQDIVSANYSNNAITIIKNNVPQGNTAFNASMFSLASTIYTNSPYNVIATDFDADGKLDLATTNYYYNTISVFKNNGYPGTFLFSTGTTYATGSYPMAITSADIDNDGRQEIAVTNYSSNTISIYKNNSTSTTLTFGTAVNFTVGTAPNAIHTADMDGDGKNDLVVGNSYSYSISIFRNAGSTATLSTSSLNTRVDFAASNTATLTGLCIGELNGDGKPDILGTNGSTTNGQFFWQNNATSGSINSSSLSARVDYSAGIYNSEFPAICDLDNDNRNDVIMGSPNNPGIFMLKNQISVFRANGISAPYVNSGASTSITFVATVPINPGNIFSAQLSDSSGSFASPVTIGSIIGTTSGNINVIIPQGTVPGFNYKIRIISTNPSLTSDPSPSFRIIVPPTISDITPTNATPGNVVQISGTNFSANTSENIVYFGAVRATVNAATTTQLTVVVPVSATDANITVNVLGNTASSSKIFSPNYVGSGVVNSTTLGTLVAFSATANPMSVDVSDVNLDGKPDVTIAQNGTTSPTLNRIFRNQTTTTINSTAFATSMSYTASGSAWNTQMADLDGDGQKDLLSVSNNAAFLSVQRNISASTTISLLTRANFTLPSNGTGLASGDIDLDGKVDVVTVNFSTNNVSLFRNISQVGTLDNNSFATRVDMSVTAGSSLVGLEDLDMDGKPELITISSTGVNATVYRNTSTNGSFSFATGITFALNSTPRGFTFGDLNNDGKPELLVTNLNSVVSVFENQSTSGTITLGTRIDLTTGSGPWGVATGDIDGNGKSDIVVANLSGSSISILANNYTSGSLSSSSFAAKVDFAVAASSQPSAISVCDIDGNLKPDVVVTLYNNSTFVVFPNNTPLFSTSFGGAQLCTGSTLTVPYTASLTFNPGNIFTAQLSDANGSFASPTTLGSVIATTSGNITGTIPANTPAGNGYKIRIISSSPSLTSSPNLNAIKVSNCPIITAVSPLSGPIGTSVTISGANFSTTASNNIVYFGAVKATVTSATSTSIVTANPLGNNLKDITVTTLETGLTANKNLTFNTTFLGGTGALSSTNFANTINVASPGSSPQGVSTADFDGDGISDFVGVSTSGNTITVFKNGTPANSAIGSIGFSNSITLSIPNSSYCVKSGDLDGDGKIDIVVYGYNSAVSSVAIFKNTSTVGTLSFAPRIDLTTAYTSYVGDLVDLDNDGKLDIVTASGSAAFSIFKNNTQGNLTASSFTRTDITTSFSFNNLSHGDFDLDGLNDLVFTGGASVVYVYRNLTGVISTSMFAAPISLSTGSGASCITACDLNFDNKPDLAIANYSSNTITIYRNAFVSGTLSASSFALQTTLTSSSGSWGISPLDIDGDNKIDLANGTQSNGMYMFKNTTSTSGGTISFNTLYYAGSGNYVFIDVADFNNDGKLDVVGANYGAGTYTIFQNTTPTFSVLSVGSGAYCSGSTVTVPYNAPTGSFNLGNIFTAQLSDSSGSFASPTNIGSAISTASGSIISTLPTNIPGGSNYRIRVISSSPTLTTDNSTQIMVRACPVITSISANTAQVGSSIIITGSNFSSVSTNNAVYFGSVKATVTAASNSQLTVTVPAGSISGPITLTVGDFSTISQQAFYPTFTGTGTLSGTSFATRGDVLTGLSGVRGTTFADFDNDGKPDFVTAVTNSNTINVYRNVSSGSGIGSTSFATPIVLAATNQPWLQVAADLTNDGLLDLATINLGSNTISIFKNTTTSVGSISFATKVDVNLSISATPYGIAAGDIDGDGLIDLAVSNLSLGSVSLFKNQTVNGVISFSTPVNFTTPTQPAYVVIGEFDGDGKPDLATANFGNNNISIFRNTSTVGTINSSSLATRIDITAGSGPFAITAADIDGDNKLDILAPNFSTNNLYIFRNTSSSGSINFTSSVFSTSGASGLNFVTTGDLDGDGKQDIVTSNNSSNNITVYKNTSTSGTINLATGFNLTGLSGLSTALIGDFDADNRPDIFATNSNANTVSVFRNVTLAPEPTINASAFAVTASGNTSLTLGWTNGNGSRRIVLAKLLTAVNATPVDENTYTANSVFGQGTQLGTGNYVVYDGTGTSVTVTGLNLLTQYYFRIFEYNGSGSTINYLTTGTTVASGTTLPVTLVSFTGKEQAGKAVLTWTTSTELNNSHFDVERSMDGINFKKVGEVAGSGNSSTIKQYRFVDELTNAKVIYYRLKQVDYNGEFEYSNIINLTAKGLNAATQISIFPNPASGSISIDGLTEQAIVYDAVGRAVLTINTNGLVDVSQLTPGVYFVKTSTETVKFVKQ